MEHKSLASTFKNVTKQRPEIIKRVRYLCIRFLLILFLAISYCLFGGILFKSLEGDQEANYKCGVKRVRREFIDDLWAEASNLKESDWKSSARGHLLEFEKQLHEAVDAGITHTSSGSSSWTLSNSIYYSTSLIFTLGYAAKDKMSELGRIVTLVYTFCGVPIGLLTINELSRLLVFIVQTVSFVMVQYKENGRGCRGSFYLIKYAKPLSASFLKTIQQPNNYLKQNAKDGVNKNMEIEEDKYVDETISTLLPLAFSGLLFSVFFILSSIFYCALFLWRNPLDGLFFTGMLFTTTENADTVSKDTPLFLCSMVVVLLGISLFHILQLSVQAWLRQMLTNSITWLIGIKLRP